MSFYVTTPIYYVNAEPHIGHVYSTLIADVLARWARLHSVDTLFLTGTDEHGQKIQEASEKAGKPTKEFVDEMSDRFKTTFEKLEFTPNHFIRTTDPHHKKRVLEIWDRLRSTEDIYMGKYAGWYNVSDETFVQKSMIEERDGRKFCAETGKELVWHEEDNYMFRLSAYQERLLDFYEARPDWIIPEVRQAEIINFVKSGLEDLSVSRKRTTCSWGIEVGDDQVVYVWLDALTNYLSGTDMGNKPIETPPPLFKNCPEESRRFYEYKYWPGTHVIGKDILKFHAVYWPAFLMALQIERPKHIVAHGWWTKDGAKISKSTGNTFDPIQKAQEYGMDQLRYYLLRETSFSSDGDFSDQRMRERINGELANTFGNLVSRVLTLANGQMIGMAELSELDKIVIHECAELEDRLGKLMTRYDIRASLEEIWRVLGVLNRYMNDTEPWRLRREDTERFGTVMYILVESIRCIGVLLSPFMPRISSRILATFSANCWIECIKWGALPQNSQYNFEKMILFSKI